jgi:hypothetical protein
MGEHVSNKLLSLEESLSDQPTAGSKPVTVTEKALSGS